MISPTPAGRAAAGLRRAFQQQRNYPTTKTVQHRTVSTNSNDGNKPSDPARQAKAPSPKTIPGPSWLYLEQLQTPFRHYTRFHQRRPNLTQLLSGIIIYFLGDASAQRIQSSSPDDGYDPVRAARTTLIGALASVPAYKWFTYLGDALNVFRWGWLNVAMKVVFNQCTFVPVFNVYFFGMQSLLSGHSIEGAWERVTHTVPESWKNSWKVWPAVTAINLALVPVHWRSVFAGESSFAVG